MLAQEDDVPLRAGKRRRKRLPEFSIECDWSYQPLNGPRRWQNRWQLYRRYSSAVARDNALRQLNKQGHGFVRYRIGGQYGQELSEKTT